LSPSRIVFAASEAAKASERWSGVDADPLPTPKMLLGA
jgi:hypothetical protein